ncbi:MAG TPA: sialate O-acetylesterase [Allosphingosinicella sp.]|nr:sialate O-acetylesterase [Allosphingosinicella sp.]
MPERVLHSRLAAAVFAGVLIIGLVAASLLLRPPDESGCQAFAAPGNEVWLGLGQSNAANFTQDRGKAVAAVGAYDGRRCRTARDPLPGADGDGGSLWTPLAQAWVSERRAARVLITVTALSATSIADWQPGGELHRRALARIDALARRGLTVTRILWVQGEADAILGTAGADYERRLRAALEPLHRASGAPVYIARVGRCGDAFSPAVRAAQDSMIASRNWARPGPDLDLIGPADRHERCHFARSGQRRAVALWLDALRGNQDLRPTP